MKNKIIKWFKYFIPNKQKILLSDYLNEVAKIAKEYDEDYFTLYVEFNSFNGLSFQAYINGFNHVQGKNINEICLKLRQLKKVGVVNEITDVIL